MDMSGVIPYNTKSWILPSRAAHAMWLRRYTHVQGIVAKNLQEHQIYSRLCWSRLSWSCTSIQLGFGLGLGDMAQNANLRCG